MAKNLDGVEVSGGSHRYMYKCRQCGHMSKDLEKCPKCKIPMDGYYTNPKHNPKNLSYGCTVC